MKLVFASAKARRSGEKRLSVAEVGLKFVFAPLDLPESESPDCPPPAVRDNQKSPAGLDVVVAICGCILRLPKGYFLDSAQC